MPIIDFFFTFEGRVGRAGFLFAYTILLLLPYLVVVLCGGSLYNLEKMPEFRGFVTMLSAPVIIITAKRYHDLGMPSWWVAVPFACGPLAAMAVIFGYLATQHSGFLFYALICSVVALGACGITLWHGVKLSFFRGIPGPNEYGREPSFWRDLLSGTSKAEHTTEESDWMVSRAMAPPRRGSRNDYESIPVHRHEPFRDSRPAGFGRRTR
ncbi:MAG: DUF805 domain-containing protein [Proteobacteria bacterium]|nr:DUF805 domain-containing protein [Pseudomonadota bacterium]